MNYGRKTILKSCNSCGGLRTKLWELTAGEGSGLGSGGQRGKIGTTVTE